MEFLLGGQGTLSGKSAVISDGSKFRIAMVFGNKSYWADNFSFDGEKIDIGFIQPAIHSNLGTFFLNNPDLLKEGLLGGTLSTAWPLLSLDSHQAQLENAGMKAVDGRTLRAANYRMKKGTSDLAILLYFEPDTSRHVHSTYEWTRGRSIGRSSNDPNVGETRFRLDEAFEGFQAVDGITLPSKWTMHFESQGGTRQQYIQQWTVTISKVIHNVPIDPRNYLIPPPGK